MIFVDETGRRWFKVKSATGAAVAAIVVPAGVLVAASFLYLPNTGALFLPRALSGIENLVRGGDDTPAAYPASSPSPTKTSTTKRAAAAVKTASQAALTTLPAPGSAAAITAIPATTTNQTTAISPTATPAVTKITPSGQTIPTDAGNSAYGQSHKK